MKKNKGQALVEFVLLIPFVTLIFLIIFDFSNIYYTKYLLETKLDEVSILYKNSEKTKLKELLRENKLDIIYNYSENFVEIGLTKKLDLLTPLSDALFEDPYLVKAERIIYEK